MPDALTILREHLQLLEQAADEVREQIAQLSGVNKLTPAQKASRVNGHESIEQLRLLCLDQGIVIFPGDLVSEMDAARLLHRSRRTLQNWRKAEQLPKLHHMGRRVVALEHIARLLEGGPRVAHSWPIPGLDDDGEHG